jgi:hypothetical protein
MAPKMIDLTIHQTYIYIYIEAHYSDEPKDYGLGNSFDLYIFRLNAMLNLEIQSYYPIKIKNIDSS